MSRRIGITRLIAPSRVKQSWGWRYSNTHDTRDIRLQEARGLFPSRLVRLKFDNPKEVPADSMFCRSELTTLLKNLFPLFLFFLADFAVCVSFTMFSIPPSILPVDSSTSHFFNSRTFARSCSKLLSLSLSNRTEFSSEVASISLLSLSENPLCPN